MFQYKCWEKLDRYSSEHWRNKNRRIWTEGERTKLKLENSFTCAKSLTKNDVLIRLIDRHIDAAIYKSYFDENDTEYLLCGKVIDIGTQAFHKNKCPGGSIATLNDYVVVDYDGGHILEYFSNRYFTLRDDDILGVLPDPFETIER